MTAQSASAKETHVFFSPRITRAQPKDASSSEASLKNDTDPSFFTLHVRGQEFVKFV